MLGLAFPAMAAFSGPGAQAPAAASTMTVAQALKAYDDTRCVLEGSIVEKLTHDTYVFQDATGRMSVEIDRDVFGAEVTPANKVRIYGTVDTKKNRPSEVDVKRLEIVK